MSIRTKNLVIKRFGWKRICKNTQRFGWVLDDAVQHEETTVTTSYEGRIVDDKVYIDEHKKSSTIVSIHLSFYRNSDDYANLPAIFLFELIYNIVFFIRRIMGTLVLPLLTVVFAIVAALGKGMDSPLGSYWGISIAIWLGLIILENIFALISSKILRLK